jgi:zinc protease
MSKNYFMSLEYGLIGHGFKKEFLKLLLLFSHLLKTSLSMGAVSLLWASVGLSSAHAAPPIQHWRLNGGAEVFLITTPNLPMLDLQVDFDAGSRRDPPAKAGLSSAVSMMMTKGFKSSALGAAMDENALGQAWADLGANWSVSSSQDKMSFRLRTLSQSETLAAAIETAAKVISQPSFDPRVFARERAKAVDGLKESITQPGTLANRAFLQNIYPTHPYGVLLTEESIKNTEISDLEDFYKTHIQVCGAKISMVGNLGREQANEVAVKLMAGLATRVGCAKLAQIPPVPDLTKPTELRIDFESAQAHVLIGQPAIERSDPDYFALTVGNYVLGGGGFVSRLTNEVREKRGLSYSVYSYFSPAKQAGPFTLGLQTRPDQAQQAIEISRKVLSEFVKKGPTATELKAAKDNLIGGFPLRLDSNKKLLDNLSNIAWYELPLDYLDTWSARVERVSIEQIKTAFARHLQPDRMVGVVVGGKFEAR